MKCPLCKSKKYRKKFASNNNQYIHCRCDHIYATNTPKHKQNILQTEKQIQYDQQTRLYKRKEELNTMYTKKKPKLLDIGSAQGSFLEVTSYMDCIGIDLDKKLVKYSNDNGFKTVCMNIYDYKPKERYEIITMFEVLEHLDNPGKAIKKIKQLLKRNGIIAISTPNTNSFVIKLFGRHHRHFSGTHINLFNIKNLQKLLLKHKFKTIKKRTEGNEINLKTLILLNHQKDIQSTEHTIKKQNEKQTKTYRTIKTLLNIIDIIPTYITNKLCLGNYIVIYAKK